MFVLKGSRKDGAHESRVESDGAGKADGASELAVAAPSSQEAAASAEV